MSQEGDERHKTKCSWGKRRGRSQTPPDDPNCVLTFHLSGAWSSTQLSRWERGKKSGKPGVKLSTRQKRNEDHQWELPPPTKTHLNLTIHEALQAKKMGQFPRLISSITVSAKTEVNIVCKQHLWWRHLSLAAGCITYRTQNNQGAEQEPTQVLVDYPFTSMPIEGTNSFLEDAQINSYIFLLISATCP